MNILEKACQELSRIAHDQNLVDDFIRVKAGPISPLQAIGTPVRQDYPLLTGKEVIVEAEFRGGFGQAFTSQPRLYEGSLREVLELPLGEPGNRAILLSTLNAVASHLGLANRVRHCRNEEPEECAVKIAKELLERFGRIRIGMIGYQPAILEHLAEVFDAGNVACTDLNPANIGQKRYGVDIWDGGTRTIELINWCELVLVTSSTLANDTFDVIEAAARERGKKLMNFGITGAGVSALLGIERICFNGH